MRGSGLFRRDAADDACAVVDGLLAVESPLLASESLADDFGVFGD